MKDGISHLAFVPRSDTLVVAAGDKSGHVGIWHVDALQARFRPYPCTVFVRVLFFYTRVT